MNQVGCNDESGLTDERTGRACVRFVLKISRGGSRAHNLLVNCQTQPNNERCLHSLDNQYTLVLLSLSIAHLTAPAYTALLYTFSTSVPSNMLVQMLLGAFARSTSCSSSSFLSESDPADHSTKISEDESSCSGCWSSSSEEEEVEYNGERIQLPVSIHGRLNYDIYERIIDATLSSLSFFNPSPPPAPPSENDDDDEDGQATAIRFLRTCCLVNSTFESIARRRLYASTKYSECSVLQRMTRFTISLFFHLQLHRVFFRTSWFPFFFLLGSCLDP